MLSIWSKVADKTKLLALLEQELEVLQLQKLNLESNVISSSCERSDMLLNQVLDKNDQMNSKCNLNTRERLININSKTKSAGKELLSEVIENVRNNTTASGGNILNYNNSGKKAVVVTGNSSISGSKVFRLGGRDIISDRVRDTNYNDELF